MKKLLLLGGLALVGYLGYRAWKARERKVKPSVVRLARGAGFIS